jgi:hypothetical protein
VRCEGGGEGLGIVELMLEWTTCSTYTEGDLHMLANSHSSLLQGFSNFTISRSPQIIPKFKRRTIIKAFDLFELRRDKSSKFTFIGIG